MIFPVRSWSRSSAGGGTRVVVFAGVFLVAAFASGCSTRLPPAYERRVVQASREIAEDPAIEARRGEVKAAIARERGEVAIEDFEFRVQGQYEGDHELELTARVPVPHPTEVRARREASRAETETALSRLEETALSVRAERCFRAVEVSAYRERVGLYEVYAKQLQPLLEWNEEWRRSGSLNEQAATQFEIEARIKLATRKPAPLPVQDSGGEALPPTRRRGRRLVKSDALVRETVRNHNPSVALREATSRRYQALSTQAGSENWPWFEFVDLFYEPIAPRNRENQIGGQVAFRIPFGVRSRASVDRYDELSQSGEHEGARIVQEQMRLGLLALEELDHFERNAEQWQELLLLARKAEVAAESWWKERLAKPSRVAGLVDEAYAARAAVLAARERAATASCTLLAATGVALEDWPRE